MPDAPGTELLAQALRDAHGDDAVLGTEHFRAKGAINVAPTAIGEILETLRGKGFQHLMSVHGVDYYPEEPRLGVHYELLDRDALDRVSIKLRVPLDTPNVPSDLEQMPHLLNFLEKNGVVLANQHTPLIAHTAVDLLTTLTGLYGDRSGVPIGNSYRFFNPNGTSNTGVSFAYWTSPIFSPGNPAQSDTSWNMLTAPLSSSHFMIRLLGMSLHNRYRPSPNQTGPSLQRKPCAMRSTEASLSRYLSKLASTIWTAGSG